MPKAYYSPATKSETERDVNTSMPAITVTEFMTVHGRALALITIGHAVTALC